VSISTASRVNHQSQLRVPPTPADRGAGLAVAEQELQPRLSSAVVLPAPGAPMNMYQGSSYR
jgi:hypothetical protein